MTYIWNQFILAIMNLATEEEMLLMLKGLLHFNKQLNLLMAIRLIKAAMEVLAN